MTPAAQTQTLRLERTFDATPEEVWGAFVDPARYARWICPYPGIDAEVHELDARVGGRVRFTMRGPNGHAFPETRFTIEKLDKPREIVQFEPNDGRDDVFADHPMRTTLRFEALPGGKTRMTCEVAGLPAAVPLEMAREGFGACLGKLAALLAGKPAAPKPNTLLLERTFDATPEELWAAWTEPAQYAKWFNPAPIDLVIREFDVRVGGKISFDMPQPNGDKNPQSGVFHVVSPYTELVSGEPDGSFLVATRFEPQGPARTRVRVEVTGLPPEYREPATVGWGVIFDRLQAHLRARRS